MKTESPQTNNIKLGNYGNLWSSKQSPEKSFFSPLVFVNCAIEGKLRPKAHKQKQTEKENAVLNLF